MMLHALALGADKDFPNEFDHKRTPLIQAILSVRYFHTFSLSFPSLFTIKMKETENSSAIRSVRNS